MMRESSSVPALPHAALTASHISTENSGSVWVKVSGLYWYMNLVPCLDVHSSVSCLTILVCSTASAIVCSLELLKTTVRNRQEVALYMCRITCLAPATASTVRLMRSALAGVRTCNYIRIGRIKKSRIRSLPESRRHQESPCSRSIFERTRSPCHWQPGMIPRFA